MRASLTSVRGRVFGPGPRPARSLGIGIFAAACIGLLAYGAVSHFPSSSAGGLPSWLPKSTLPVNRVVAASAAHPQLAVEGDAVEVDLSGGEVRATAVGPNVPEEGEQPVPATSPCTFVVTFTAAEGVVPLAASEFSILDEQSHLHHPHITTASGGTVPKSVSPGRTLSLLVSDVLPTGNGQIRWAPQGSTPIVAWDFDVEID